MNTPRTRHRAWYRPVATAAGIAALATTALAGPGHAGTMPAAAAVQAEQRVATHASAPGNAQALRMPGLGATSHTMTLITGDRVTLTAAGSGRFTVTTTPAPGAGPLIDIRAHGGPSGLQSLVAIPTAAEEFVNTGSVDRSVFDVQYLATHGDDGIGGRIPLTLRYGGHLDAVALSAKAAALPEATTIAAHPASGTVDISVRASRAADFWATLTGQRPGQASLAMSGYPVGRPAPHLTGGAVTAWLTGHQTSPPAKPAGQPEYQVTEDIKYSNHPGTGCGIAWTLCNPVGMYLLGITGPAAGQPYYAASETCIDANPCTTWQVTYVVPPGVYDASGLAAFDRDGVSANVVDLTRPQITITADTQFTVDVDQAQQLTVTTPQPTQLIGGYVMETRFLPGGTQYFANIGGYVNRWVVPTATRVTEGTYTLTTDWNLEKPWVTMSVTSPQRQDLHPWYPSYNGSYPWAYQGSVRFSGTHTWPLVDGGLGTAQDFSRIDAHGKLVLIQPDPSLTGADNLPPCTVEAVQLTNALQAGAAGVLINPTYVYNGSAYPCSADAMSPSWWTTHGAVPLIPWVTLQPSDVASLRSMLQGGPVQLSVADSGPSPYRYHVTFSHEGQIPAADHLTLTSRQFVAVRTTYHRDTAAGAQPYGYIDNPVAWRPDEYVTFGYGEAGVPPGAVREEYYGPVAPDTVWSWVIFPFSSTGSEVDYPQQAEAVLDQRGASQSQDWYGDPAVPGAAQPDTDVDQVQPATKYPIFCMLCRQGDTLFPVVYLVQGAGSRVRSAGLSIFAAGQMHLYQGGQEIPQTPWNGLPTYQLAPQQARYKLTTQAGNISTDWDFTSAPTATDQTPPGLVCLAAFFHLSQDPCHADPLVFLRYNAFTDPANTVTAPGTHQLQVTAYHQAPGAPAITGLKLWISTDGGTTWQQVRVAGQDGGTYTGTYTVPALSSTNGYASIKAQASDATGNDVTQTITNAYSLTAPPASAGR